MPAVTPTNSQEVALDVARSLSGELTDPSTCRAITRRALSGRVDEPLLDDVILVVSELVTNAVLHGAAPLVFHLLVAGADLVVGVDDHESVMDFGAVRRAPGDVRGRGLSIIEQLADAWGIDASPAGKTVWARFDLRQDRVRARPSGR
jgi:anti-sigma regulatory factor (Ser/Thr protein kinase)